MKRSAFQFLRTRPCQGFPLTQIERGLRQPRLDTILKLSAGLGDATHCDLMRGLQWLPGRWVEGAFSVADEIVLRVLAGRD